MSGGGERKASPPIFFIVTCCCCGCCCEVSDTGEWDKAEGAIPSGRNENRITTFIADDDTFPSFAFLKASPSALEIKSTLASLRD